MPLPAIIAGVSLGSKLLGGLFGNKAKKKQLDAQKRTQEAEHKAAMDSFNRTGAEHGVQERRRGARLEGIQQLISGAGSGNYSLPPELVARLQEQTPFTGQAPTLGVDPSAGAGSALLSGLFGQTGGIADSIIAGRAASQAPKSPGQPVDPNANIPYYLRKPVP